MSEPSDRARDLALWLEELLCDAEENLDSNDWARAFERAHELAAICAHMAIKRALDEEDDCE